MHFHEHRRHLTARELHATTGLTPASRRFKGGGGIGGIIGGIIGSVVGGPVGAAIGAGLGSTAGGLASGQSFGDALKGGLMTGAMGGLTAGLGGGLSGAIGESALGATLGGMGSSALGYGLTGLGTGALGAMMTGQNPLKGALIGGLTGAAGGALNSYVSDQGGLSGIFGSSGNPDTAAIQGTANASGATLGETGASSSALGAQAPTAGTTDTSMAAGPLAQAANAPIESTSPVSSGDFTGNAAPTDGSVVAPEAPTATQFGPLGEVGAVPLPAPSNISASPLAAGNTTPSGATYPVAPEATQSPYASVDTAPSTTTLGDRVALAKQAGTFSGPGQSPTQYTANNIPVAAQNTPAAMASAATDTAKQGILGKLVDSSVPFTQDPLGWIGNNKLLSLGIGGTALSALSSGLTKPPSMPTPPQMAGTGSTFTPQNYTWGGVPGVTARTVNPYKGNFATYGQSTNPAGFLFFNPQQLQPVVTAATGGHVAALNMLNGGHSKGPGTGTSDSVPALLSNGEFVLPTDVVNKLGSGNNDKGAAKLHRLMGHVRKGGALSMMGA